MGTDNESCERAKDDNQALDSIVKGIECIRAIIGSEQEDARARVRDKVYMIDMTIEEATACTVDEIMGARRSRAGSSNLMVPTPECIFGIVETALTCEAKRGRRIAEKMGYPGVARKIKARYSSS